MFKFRGFRASFDFITGKQRGLDCDLSSVSVNGAYRSSKDDYNDGELVYNPSRKLIPYMAQLPNSQSKPLKTSKSTGDLTKETNRTQNKARSSNDLSLNGNTESKIQLKERKKIEKQRMLEQKRQEKIAIQERQRQEKLAAQERKKQEKLEIQRQEKLAAQKHQRQEKLAREQTKQDNKQDKPEAGNKLRSKKKTAPIPPQPTTVNLQIPKRPYSQVPQNTAKQTNTNEITEPKTRKPTQTNARNNQASYSTNTLESSISKSSGPPPYGEYPEIITDRPNTNITFGKPVTDSSWDLISQHREQMSRNKAPIVPKRKNDLQYNVGNLCLEENSDA